MKKFVLSFSLMLALVISTVCFARYTGIWNTSCRLDIYNSYKLDCYGSTSTYDDYYAEVIVELQQKVGRNWNTIETWDDSDWEYACVDERYTVDSGYKYQLKVTHRAYDEDMNMVDETYSYSSIASM